MIYYKSNGQLVSFSKKELKDVDIQTLPFFYPSGYSQLRSYYYLWKSKQKCGPNLEKCFCRVSL